MQGMAHKSQMSINKESWYHSSLLIQQIWDSPRAQHAPRNCKCSAMLISSYQRDILTQEIHFFLSQKLIELFCRKSHRSCTLISILLTLVMAHERLWHNSEERYVREQFGSGTSYSSRVFLPRNMYEDVVMCRFISTKKLPLREIGVAVTIRCIYLQLRV